MYLEHQREVTLSKKIIVIQKMVKGWHQRRKFLKMKKNIVVIQAAYRGYAQRKRYMVSQIHRFIVILIYYYHYYYL